MKTKEKAAPAETVEVLENFVPLYLKGMQVIAELQKKTLQIAAQQNAEWAGAGKKALVRFIPASQVNRCSTWRRRHSTPWWKATNRPSTW